LINVVDVDNTVARLSKTFNESSRIKTNFNLGVDNFTKLSPMKDINLSMPKFDIDSTLSDI